MKGTLHKLLLAVAVIICQVTFSVVLTACSSDKEDQQEPTPAADGRKLRHLTIDGVSLTRATLTDNGTSVAASWKAGDVAKCFNYTASNPNLPSSVVGNLTAADNEETSLFTGEIDCKQDDELILFYPAKAITTKKETGELTYKWYYTIDLNGQKGTLADVATNFHYVYGVGRVTSVTGSTANAQINPMKSLLPVCKFTFKHGDNPIHVKTLQINFVDDISNMSFPLTTNVALSTNPDVVNASFDFSVDNGTLSVDLSKNVANDGVVYVALCPIPAGDSETLKFTVTDDNAVTYTGSVSIKSGGLQAGKFYKLTKALEQTQTS